jgi:AcrR family transcriptional regulator
MPRSKETAVSSSTREALILAGERLFAEHGINGVSLRQINADAGQKNSSAAHYHFGSKQALIKAIHSYRLERVNRRRRLRLKSLHEAGEHGDVRALVETIVYPIIEEIHETEGGSYYIRCLAQIVSHPQMDVSDLWSRQIASGLMEALDLLEAATPGIPSILLRQRFGLMWEQAIHALSDREQLRALSTGGRDADLVLFVSNLVDMIAGGLSAPVSETTKHEYRSYQLHREKKA